MILRSSCAAGVLALACTLTSCGSSPTPSTTAPQVAAPALGAEGALLVRGRYAVLLKDGRVLAAGGEPAGEPSATVEIYDPKTNQWAKADPLRTARRDHALVVLGDGRVLVLGGLPASKPGQESKPLDSCELFDPKTGRWGYSLAMRAPRKSHTATLLPDGRVLVVGDPNSDIFDVTAGQWLKDPLPTVVPYDGHTATALSDGRVLVMGTAAKQQRASAEIFDPSDNTWKAVGPPAHPLTGHTATLMPDGTVLLIGGTKSPPQLVPVALAFAAVFEPKRERWNFTGQPETTHYRHTAVVLQNGEVVVSGGSMGEPEVYANETFRPLSPELRAKLGL